ncbi:hypothetical protein, partial [Escherichia coli]|uniref:hypothetical protein n=1 Tax=Escherichia coli TaxID=562 RepID=UPI003CE4BB0C
MAEVSEREGFVLVTPNALGTVPGWNAEFFNFNALKVDDVAFMDKLIDKVEGEVGVDTSRVFVAGHSNGAFMA